MVMIITSYIKNSISTDDLFPSVKHPYQDILVIQTPTQHICGCRLSFNQESGQMKMPVSRQRGPILFLEVVYRSNLSLHVACDAKRNINLRMPSTPCKTVFLLLLYLLFLFFFLFLSWALV
jgi:hypothetical protein